jgi:hypothetical protein
VFRELSVAEQRYQAVLTVIEDGEHAEVKRHVCRGAIVVARAVRRSGPRWSLTVGASC